MFVNVSSSACCRGDGSVFAVCKILGPPLPMALPAGNLVRRPRNDPSGTIRNEGGGTSGGGRTRIACEFVTRPCPNFWEDNGERLRGTSDLWYLLRQWPLLPVTQYVAPGMICPSQQRAGGGTVKGGPRSLACLSRVSARPVVKAMASVFAASKIFAVSSTNGLSRR